MTYWNSFCYVKASWQDLLTVWEKDIRCHPEDPQWIIWKQQYLTYHRLGMCQTFVVKKDDHPVGQATLLFSPKCQAIQGRTQLADGKTIVNINALRIDAQFQGQGHSSRLIRVMEQEAIKMDYQTITIGVEAKEHKNLAIYRHWGYTQLIHQEYEDNTLVLYFSKPLQA